ncbi:ABC transporter ATP-binding protein [Sphaerisporangium sp. TRM90804]|uniref:ABC transporter ATP-binding protein n=1 Tax=Sphaerisporangium sp. TRM90804 TaxID=3031113 RepID=UPI002448A669|nr:ABC transporter ATP-binding protein [Sphaerisporangium sp. TRM90804]MDH2425110.1 ATP-binding cassette domain-containing protein [Sphaerisporangium sp. TRM90804]
MNDPRERPAHPGAEDGRPSGHDGPAAEDGRHVPGGRSGPAGDAPEGLPGDLRPVGSGEPLVVVEGVTRVYRTGPKEVVALRDVSFEAYPGELVTIRGRSGSGKTTLLNQIGGLDRPDGGRVVVAGRTVTELPEAGLLELRRDVVGYVFQAFGLIPVLSAAENVGVPMRLARTPVPERERRVAMLLSMVGLEKHANQRPYELSGGQQQRVAVARALANRPRLLIADEPTGQLDSQTGRQIMLLLRAVVRSEGVTALVATHDPALLTLSDRTLELRDGALVPAEPQPAGVTA